MAAHEINLATPEELPTSNFNDDNNEEKRRDSESSLTIDPDTTTLDESSPIIYHYLTFEEVLPSPSTQPSILPSASSPPPPPNLTKYLSPFEWSKTRKNFTIILSCIATLLTAYAAGSYASGTAQRLASLLIGRVLILPKPPNRSTANTEVLSQMSALFHVSEVSIAVGITSFCSGFAIAPMVLAPFSEINGRYPVFVVSGILYFVCQICCAVTRSYPGMIVARFFVGCGSSVFSTMVGGVVSDLYHASDRNTPMALFSGGALFGTGLGPLVSGFIAQHLNWRWIFWVQVISNGLLVTIFTLIFKETRGSVILSRKAHCLNDWYEDREKLGYFGFNMVVNGVATPQRIRWKVKADEERQSLTQMIKISVYRPFHMLTTEPVVFFFSLWVAFAWAVLYLTFGSIPLVFGRSHNFTIEQSGCVFAALSIAATLSTILSIFQESLLEKFIHKLGKEKTTDSLGRTATQASRFTLRKLDLTSPEGRLYFACIESALLPIGLFWFGWTQFNSIPWIVPTLAIGCSTMGIYSVYLATFNYLADTYHRYASSALAAQSFCRNLLGGIFPLVTAAMFNNLTFQGAASLLGGIGALLTIVPWVLVFYGPRIRARSKFAREIM